MIDALLKRYILHGITINIMDGIMETAKIFTNGRSQAVRLPKAFRFNGNEVYIKKTSEGYF